MKKHKEMFEALLAGETLEEFNGYYLRIEGDDLLFKNPEGLLAPISNISFRNPQDWRIKPKTININGFEVPEPTRKPLNYNQTYFIPDIDACLREDKGRLERAWTNHEADRARLSLGIVHLTEEAAILHTEALLSFTRKNND